MPKYKPLTVEQIIKLNKIYNRTKKHRIKNKIISRLVDGTFEYFDKWLYDDEKDRDENEYAIMPTDIELAKMYGKDK